MKKFTFGHCFGGRCLALVLGAAALVTVSASASAAVVEHEGVIFSDLSVGGLNFSRIYTGDSSYGGGGSFKRLGTIYNEDTGQHELNDVPITYRWDTKGDNVFSAGDTASFVSPFATDTLVYSSNTSYYGTDYRYDITLLESQDSVLTIGDALTTSINAGGGTVVSHTVSGQLKFKIERFVNDSLTATLTDFVSFDDQILFSVVNGALESDQGGIQMFLWGDTFDGNEGMYPGDIPQEVEYISYGGQYHHWKKKKKKKVLVDMEDAVAYDCEGDSYACDKITKKFYGHEDVMVWKMALNGTPTTVVPVPGALPLMISALVGIGIVARRRRSAA